MIIIIIIIIIIITIIMIIIIIMLLQVPSLNIKMKYHNNPLELVKTTIKLEKMKKSMVKMDRFSAGVKSNQEFARL